MRGCVCGLVAVFIEGGDYALVAGKVAGKARRGWSWRRHRVGMRGRVQKIRRDRMVHVKWRCSEEERASSALRGLPAVNSEFPGRSKFQKAWLYTALARSSSRILLARDNEFRDRRVDKSRRILSRLGIMEGRREARRISE